MGNRPVVRKMSTRVGAVADLAPHVQRPQFVHILLVLLDHRGLHLFVELPNRDCSQVFWHLAREKRVLLQVVEGIDVEIVPADIDEAITARVLFPLLDLSQLLPLRHGLLSDPFFKPLLLVGLRDLLEEEHGLVAHHVDHVAVVLVSHLGVVGLVGTRLQGHEFQLAELSRSLPELVDFGLVAAAEEVDHIPHEVEEHLADGVTPVQEEVVRLSADELVRELTDDRERHHRQVLVHEPQTLGRDQAMVTVDGYDGCLCYHEVVEVGGHSVSGASDLGEPHVKDFECLHD